MILYGAQTDGGRVEEDRQLIRAGLDDALCSIGHAWLGCIPALYDIG